MALTKELSEILDVDVRTCGRCRLGVAKLAFRSALFLTDFARLSATLRQQSVLSITKISPSSRTGSGLNAEIDTTLHDLSHQRMRRQRCSDQISDEAVTHFRWKQPSKRKSIGLRDVVALRRRFGSHPRYIVRPMLARQQEERMNDDQLYA
jgi:hypothetical protein